MLKHRNHLVLVSTVLLGLTGCTFTASLTVPADSVGEQAAKALTDQLGTDVVPEMDCGEDDVKLINGTVVACVLTDPTSNMSYDAPVTISEVNGTNYHVAVQVGDAPIGGTPAPDASGAPTTPGSSLAAVAADGLESTLGYRPAVDCGDDRVSIVQDAQFDCVVTLDDALDYPATVSITSVIGGDYTVNVAVAATPVG